VEAQKCVELTGTNARSLDHINPWLNSKASNVKREATFVILSEAKNLIDVLHEMCFMSFVLIFASAYFFGIVRFSGRKV
jgi:hypothetical protein